ncbi:helix-turn-helix transcriptional regulator [Spirosoma sp. SC4-14]|uniref:helix-turn-helix transcriptional regulator n=1 Tax=Spirosoma sp. SC4-14 TaxID=3128900 RepID=UPI0030D29630
MTINDKIKQILIDKNLTPSYFADEIGVQRSSISHILSGRNRPSFDIIQKIIRRFPELGYEWIMEEESSPATAQPTGSSYPSSRPSTRSTVEKPDPFTPRISYATTQPIGARSQRNEIPPSAPLASTASAVPLEDSATATAEKKVERILIFYSDGSFREFLPAAQL